MRKMKYIIGIMLLFMIIGFATITISLGINANTKITSDVDDFKVYYSDARLNSVSTPALINNTTSLNFNIDLASLGSQHIIEYDITNGSKMFDAAVSISCTKGNDYLSVINEFDDSNLLALTTRTGTLTLKKIKSSANEEHMDYTITCQIFATPVERDSEAVGEVPGILAEKYAILKASPYSDKSAFRSSTYKTKIKTISIEDEINVPDDAVESWDIGVTQNGNVMAYVVTNETNSEYYDLHIQSDSQLYANKDMSRWFAGLTSVESINGLDLLNTSMTTNMSNMFSGFGSYSETLNLDISSFDTSNVTSMSYMFNQTGWESTTLTIDASGLDTSKVTSMFAMFLQAGEKSQTFTLDISGLDTSNVTNMGHMFSSAGKISQTFILNVSNFDTGNVTNMSSMFGNTGRNSTNFTLDVSSFDTSNVTDMSYMFSCAGYSNPNFTLDLSNFDTSKVTNMSSMFSSAGQSNPNFILYLGNFDTSNVTDMSYMFSSTGESNINFILDLSNFDTSNVTNMSGMFSRMGGYTSKKIELILGEFDTSNVTDMSSMFEYSSFMNTSLTIKNPNTSNFSNMFADAATRTNSIITLNYTSATSDLVDQMIATKSSTSNVVKGWNVESRISFDILKSWPTQQTTYTAYEGMTWKQWVDSDFNTDGFYIKACDSNSEEDCVFFYDRSSDTGHVMKHDSEYSVNVDSYIIADVVYKDYYAWE